MFKALKKRLRRKTSSVIGLPNIYGRLDHLETLVKEARDLGDPLNRVSEFLFLLELRLKDHQESVMAGLRAEVNLRLEDLGHQADALRDAILQHLDVRSGELASHTEKKALHLQEQVEVLKTHTNQLKRELNDLRFAATAPLQRVPRQDPPAVVETTVDPMLYVRFEDRYRGSEELIAARQSEYLSVLEVHLKVGRVLDIGCGRGEWLEVLRRSNFDAYGIDSNPIAIARCESIGLTVEVGEASQHLSNLPAESLGVVSLFQVLEHVPLGALPDLLREVHRVLKPGGALVAEFPNIQSLSVGGNTFWLDPTHLRPLHPLFVEFVAEDVGFASTRLHYPKYGNETGSTSGLESAVFGPPDVALIAIK